MSAPGSSRKRPGQGLQIRELYAYVAAVPPGDEGIFGINFGGSWLPIVGADMARMRSLRAHAQACARASGERVRLVKFSVREDLEVIGP
jgi:hypothetical protein